MAPMKLRRRDAAAAESARPQREEPQREERSRSGAPRSRSRRKNVSSKTSRSTSSGAGAASASPLPSSSTTAAPSRTVLAVEDTSPDSKCPICLDRFNNLAYLDRCLHRFCFMCIQEWSHNKAECPLCKQPFSSILHSVRGHNDFQKYTLRPRPDMDSVEATIAMVAAMAGDERMRLTLRRDRDTSDTGRHRHRRNRRSVPLLEWIIHAPPGTLLNQPLVPPDEARPYELPERGIVFEGLTGLGAAGNMPPFVGNNRETRRLLAKLAARQRLQREGGSVRPLRERDMIALRRGLYRCGIRVRGVARGNHEQPQRLVSAESFCQNPSSLHRLRPWLRRELTVLYGAHDPLISIVVRLILNALARLGLEDLEPAADELRPFLLARTDQFLYELASFARSPLSMDNYDLQAVYEPPDVGFSFERIDSSDSSAVIAISEDEERDRAAPLRGPPAPDNQPPSLSGWDDETPGPSYTSVDTSCYLSGFSPAPLESTNQQSCPLTPTSPRRRDEEEDVEEECLIVGYKKPIAERTPELVQLSSDSDEDKEKEGKEGEKEKKEKEKKGEKADAEKGGSEGKEDTAANDKQPENVLPTILPAISPTTLCREEVVEDAQPSRSHSLVLSPVHSLEEIVPKDRVESRRRRREQRRNRRLRSGSFPNPNASMLPPLSSRRFSRSPSPRSSLGSDSDWAPGYSLSVSPLGSSCPSTPLSSSSSCCGSSPSSRAPAVTPPPRQADAAAEKPGGKRKYKSRHLDCDAGDPTWRPGGSGGRRQGDGRSRSKAKEVERMRREEREKRRRRRRRERQRRESGESRCREERSPSVEIIYEGTVSPSPKRKRRRQRHSLLSSSPLVITLDSDSGRDLDLDRTSSACSSPFGSQRTVDFCHFPALPLVHSSSVGGALSGGDIGELPVDILDRDSDKSLSPIRASRRRKTADLISLENSSDGSTDVDVERVGASDAADPGAGEFGNASEKLQRLQDPVGSSERRRDFRETTDFPHKANPDVADRQLLDSILSVLDGIGAKSDLPSTSNPSFLPDNHFKNCSLSNILSDKPKNSVQSLFYPSSLPPFLQLTESRKKSQNTPVSLENSDVDMAGSERGGGARTLHDLDTHLEVADSLLALQDPENSRTSCSSTRTRSTPPCESPAAAETRLDRTPPERRSDPDSLLARTAELLSDLAPSGDGPRRSGEDGFKHGDLVHEKVCGDAALRLDVRTNAEDVK